MTNTKFQKPTMQLDYKKNIILENERVRIEPLALSHLAYLTPIAIANPSLLQYSPVKFGSQQLLKAYIDNNIDLRNRELKYPFAIFDKEKNEYAGCTSFLNISLANNRLEIGSTWIGPNFQKTGLNYNCKFLLLQYVFEVLKIERLELKTDARNIQSQKAIERIGAKREGVLRSHTLMTDGYRRDTMYFSILKDEWPNIKETVFSKLSRNI